MADDLAGLFLEHVSAERLFPEAGRAVVAVSGGADSLALLYLLRDTAARLDLDLVVGHVDHGIAPASGDWAARVRDLGRAVGVLVVGARLALGAESSETVARRARYRALRAMQHEHDARYLVTAHHADDQIETVVQRFLRGSGPAGLAGMAPCGPRGLVRPLLPFGRQALAAWLAERAPDARPVADPANADRRHDRAWVRHRLLPLVRERLGGEFERRLGEGIAHAQHDRAAWRAALHAFPGLEFRRVRGGIEVAREVLRGYDKVLCAALLRASAREAGCIIGTTKSLRLTQFAMRAESGRAMQLGGGWVGEVVFDRLRVTSPSHVSGASPGEAVWGSADRGEVHWGEWSIRWMREPAGRAPRTAFTMWTSAGEGGVRAWLPGDRVYPRDGVGRRKVRRLLMEARVPRSERSAYPIVVRGSDILWIPGICRSEVLHPRPGEPSVRLDARRNRDT